MWFRFGMTQEFLIAFSISKMKLKKNCKKKVSNNIIKKNSSFKDCFAEGRDGTKIKKSTCAPH